MRCEIADKGSCSESSTTTTQRLWVRDSFHHCSTESWFGNLENTFISSCTCTAPALKWDCELNKLLFWILQICKPSSFIKSYDLGIGIGICRPIFYLFYLYWESSRGDNLAMKHHTKTKLEEQLQKLGLDIQSFYCLVRWLVPVTHCYYDY